MTHAAEIIAVAHTHKRARFQLVTDKSRTPPDELEFSGVGEIQDMVLNHGSCVIRMGFGSVDQRKYVLWTKVRATSGVTKFCHYFGLREVRATRGVT